MRRSARVGTLYHRLFQALGPQGWWPADSPFEMIVGAILTQATRWHNVELAIGRLQRAKALTPRRLLALSPQRLMALIRPAGFYRQKSQRLRAFTTWYVDQYGGRAERMFRTPWPILRRRLLALSGIGQETADAILLYAGRQPVFVSDTYTVRIFRRHRLIDGHATHETVKRLVMRELPVRTQAYNEFHALLVEAGKRFCHRRDPDCTHCPLGGLPHSRQAS